MGPREYMSFDSIAFERILGKFLNHKQIQFRIGIFRYYFFFFFFVIL